ncbi:hypothetical protein [Aliivibrio fischeri]|uniref:hypothetical protein n=1 Tax=Aliivibrio fischeri TaxID=668 RepID=UPI000B2BF6D8|nr:hypothetical protein [Aliivibrio fischeri]
MKVSILLNLIKLLKPKSVVADIGAYKKANIILVDDSLSDRIDLNLSDKRYEDVEHKLSIIEIKTRLEPLATTDKHLYLFEKNGDLHAIAGFSYNEKNSTITLLPV